MHSVAYIAMPGGFGTLDELFEIVTLVQTRKLPPAPIVLMGSAYWSGLLDWIKSELLSHQLIGPHDLSLLTVSDDLDEVMQLIQDFCADYANHLDSEPAVP